MSLLRLTAVSILLVSMLAFSDARNHSVVAKKTLPLDQVSNVTLKNAQNSHYLPNKVIIRLKNQGLSKQSVRMPSSLSIFLQRYSAQSIQQLFPESNQSSKQVNLSQFFVMTFSSPIDPFTVSQEISRQPDVLYAEPWFIYPVDEATTCTPNDSLRNLQWGLTKIAADSAFCVAAGDTNVVIGIIDTGVQWNHPDLAANIYINWGEYGPDGHGGRKESNGIDDDGDGFIDDWHGWDFGGADYNNPVGDNNPTPTNDGAAHGTHVAGIADARTNNVTGVAGVANNCRILPVKTGSDNDGRGPGGTPYIVFGFEGLLYASQMGAKVVNCSWGGSGASQFEQEIIDTVTARGTLVVAAAGNSATEDPNYPASYRGVLSVAATTTTDSKTSYTQYGENIDVSAPGGDGSTASWIYSTYYPSSYAYDAGTSMASPHAAGLAALVASKFPSYSALQIGEQVRTTCDDIYSVSGNTSTSIKYKLGKGRINALSAVTKSSPSLRMTSFRVVDSLTGNGDGLVEPNETFAIQVYFKNYLQATSSAATVTLGTFDTHAHLGQRSYPIGSVPTSGTADNGSSLFTVFADSTTPAGHVAQFVLIYADGNYKDAQLFSILMNPTYSTHDINSVKMTITDNGKIGFNDFPNNSQGVGFTYKGTNMLFEAGLMVGYSGTKIVDIVRNSTDQDADFVSNDVYKMVSPGPIAEQEGTARCTDDGAVAANKIGLAIDTHSYAFQNAPDTNYIIVRYDIWNTSGTQISNVYAGMFFDWDMYLLDGSDGSDLASDNTTSFDQTRSLGYAWDASNLSTAYCGTRALDSAAGYMPLVNYDDGSLDLSRTAKWGWLSNGINVHDTVADIHMVVSEGPYTIPAGGRKRVAFAMIAGDNLDNLKHNADLAKVKWAYINSIDGVNENGTVQPKTYALSQNYPNPFNPSTVISYALPSAGRVKLSVFNVLGQLVTTLVDHEQPAGKYDVTFNASTLSSGVYFYRLSATNSATGMTYTDVKKLLLLR